jgi:hypothetical protein
MKHKFHFEFIFSSHAIFEIVKGNGYYDYIFKRSYAAVNHGIKSTIAVLLI